MRTSQKILDGLIGGCVKPEVNFNVQFGGFSVFLVGDFAQLPPVSDKPLHHYLPQNSTGLKGCSVFLCFETVVKLTENQPVTSTDDLGFRENNVEN